MLFDPTLSHASTLLPFEMSLPHQRVNGFSETRPNVLLLGDIILAHKEWDALKAIAELIVGHAG